MTATTLYVSRDAALRAIFRHFSNKTLQETLNALLASKGIQDEVLVCEPNFHSSHDDVALEDLL